MKRSIPCVLCSLMLLFLCACTVNVSVTRESKGVESESNPEGSETVPFTEPLLATAEETESLHVLSCLIQYTDGQESSRIETEYNEEGFPIRVTARSELQEVQEAKYVFDEKGFLSEVEVSSEAGVLRTTLTRDGSDRILSAETLRPTGEKTRTEYRYDDAGMPVMIQETENGAELRREEMDYDAAGRCIELREFVMGQEVSRVQYAYEENGLLATETSVEDGGVIRRIGYAYDEFGREVKREVHTPNLSFVTVVMTFYDEMGGVTETTHYLNDEVIECITYRNEYADGQLVRQREYRSGQLCAEREYRTVTVSKAKAAGLRELFDEDPLALRPF